MFMMIAIMVMVKAMITMETLMIRVMVAVTMTYLVPERFILDKLFWLIHI